MDTCTVPPSVTSLGNVVVGQMVNVPTYRAVEPKQATPPSHTYPQDQAFLPTEDAAKRLIINGLSRKLNALSLLPEEEKQAEIAALVRGTSLTGFVKIARNDERVDTVEKLRHLLNALYTMKGRPKVFDRGNKYLFFFAIPRGWVAYAGEVKTDAIMRYYEKRDVRKKVQWNKRLAEAAADPTKPITPEEEQAVGYKEYSNAPLPGAVGYWVNLLQTTTHYVGVKMPVYTSEGEQMVYHPVPVNHIFPLHQARTLTFVVEKSTGQLLAWQPSRYTDDMTPAMRMDRVILASNETTDDVCV